MGGHDGDSVADYMDNIDHRLCLLEDRIKVQGKEHEEKIKAKEEEHEQNIIRIRELESQVTDLRRQLQRERQLHDLFKDLATSPIVWRKYYPLTSYWPTDEYLLSYLTV